MKNKLLTSITLIALVIASSTTNASSGQDRAEIAVQRITPAEAFTLRTIAIDAGATAAQADSIVSALLTAIGTGSLALINAVSGDGSTSLAAVPGDLQADLDAINAVSGDASATLTAVAPDLTADLLLINTASGIPSPSLDAIAVNLDSIRIAIQAAVAALQDPVDPQTLRFTQADTDALKTAVNGALNLTQVRTALETFLATGFIL